MQAPEPDLFYSDRTAHVSHITGQKLRMPIDQGLSNNQPVNCLLSQSIGFTYESANKLQLLHAVCRTHQTHLQDIVLLLLCECVCYSLHQKKKNPLADTNAYITAHVCKAFPSPVTLLSFLSFTLSLLHKHTHTHNRGG